MLLKTGPFSMENLLIINFIDIDATSRYRIDDPKVVAIVRRNGPLNETPSWESWLRVVPTCHQRDRTNLRDNRTFLDTLLSIRTQGLPAFTSPRRNYSW